MRDLSQWKDKVELSLDGRQLFFLFFGGAVLACVLFSLGVMTGRRIEARAIALDSPSADDPLAALDQLGDLEDEELSYHQTLTRGTRAEKPADTDAHARPAPAKPAPAVAPAKPSTVPLAPRAPAPAKPTPPAHAAAEPVVEEAPAADAPTKADPVAAPKAEPVKLAAAPAPKPVKADTAPAPKVEAAAGQAHFTLQLSAFAAKKDAEDFMKRVQAAGYRAFVVSSDLPGKGVLYRVRVGDYTSKEVAMAEKSTVEKKLKVAAYLAKL